MVDLKVHKIYIYKMGPKYVFIFIFIFIFIYQFIFGKLLSCFMRLTCNCDITNAFTGTSTVFNCHTVFATVSTLSFNDAQAHCGSSVFELDVVICF